MTRNDDLSLLDLGIHALADDNQRIQIREKTLEFSSAVFSTLSPYHL